MFFLLLFLAPVSVLACEGECIVGITKALLINYHTPVYGVFNDIANQIENQIVPPHSHAEAKLDYLGALLSGYEQESYARMETAIFPSYFHGKCEDETGSIPLGCPSPDCRLVCGTPGSLVHHYSKLRRIAFLTTRTLIAELTRQDSETYRKIESTVLKYINRPIPRMMRRRRDLASAFADQEASQLEKRAENAKERLQQILEQFSQMLEDSCGGLSEGDNESNDELGKCSWKEDMIRIILGYP